LLTMKVSDLGAEQMIGRAYRLVDDFMVPERIVVDVITARVEHRFASGDDGKWADVKAETRRRRRGDKTAPPGTDLGEMRRAVTATTEGVPHSLLRFAPDSVTIGVDTDGAAVFQNGSDDGSQPARPFLEIFDEDIDVAMDRYGAILGSVIGGH